MKQPSFKGQLDKIVQAYHMGLINPTCKNHSFVTYLLGTYIHSECGDLNHVDNIQTALRIDSVADVAYTKKLIYKESQGLYELADILRMEGKFLTVFNEHLNRSDPNEALYLAVVEAIKVLKEIHESNGETCYYESIEKADAPMMDGVWIPGLPVPLEVVMKVLNKLLGAGLDERNKQSEARNQARHN